MSIISTRLGSKKNPPPPTPPKPKKTDDNQGMKFVPVRCKICKKECLDVSCFTSDDDDSINCDICNHRFHRSCIGITSTSEWESLKGSNENVTFRCDDCLQNKGQNVNQLEMFQKLLEANNDVLLNRLDNFEKKILKSVDEKIENKMKEYEAKNKHVIEETVKAQINADSQNNQEQATIENAIKTQISQSFDELKDREERKCNLMLFNLKESIKIKEEEAIEDLESVKQVLQFTNPELKETTISKLSTNSIIRLGKKPDGPPNENSKPRPVKITLPDEATKFKVLKMSHTLKSYTENPRIGLKLDLTKQQLIEEKELRKELQRRKDLKEDVMIFRNKVILRADHQKLKNELKAKESEGAAGGADSQQQQ